VVSERGLISAAAADYVPWLPPSCRLAKRAVIPSSEAE